MTARRLRVAFPILLALTALAGPSSAEELSSGQAALLLGGLIILAPVLFVGGLALFAFWVLAPPILYARLPLLKKARKWVVVMLLAGIQGGWAVLRSHAFLSQAFSFHLSVKPLDVLPVASWLLFLVMRAKLNAYRRASVH